MPTVQEAIQIKIKDHVKTAAVPCIAVMAELYETQLPVANKSFAEVIDDLQNYTKQQFRVKDARLKMPTQQSFGNCNGRWAEYVYAVFAWNKLVELNANPAAEYVYIYTKLPNNNSSDNEWISLLDEANYNELQHFSRDGTDQEVRAAHHSAFLLCSSNPDAVILKYPKATYEQLGLRIDPCSPLDCISNAVMQKLDSLYPSLLGKVRPYDNLVAFLSIKNSIRPDRRYQFVHEGDNIKAVLLFLISRGIDRRLRRTDVQKKFYAVALSPIGAPDLRAMETAMTACLTDLTGEPIWSVDKLFQCTYLTDVATTISEILG